MRRFVSAGAFRVNAHRRRLDVWLLVRCSRCDRTDRLPVVERVPVDQVPPSALEAYTNNDPRWCARAAVEHGLVVPWVVERAPHPPPYVAELVVPPGAMLRLDRLVAHALGRSRGRVARDVADGAIVIDGRPSQKARTGQRVVVLR
ncbi:MAG: DUF1062 domain-containing protein [Myxococcota bacterium]